MMGLSTKKFFEAVVLSFCLCACGSGSETPEELARHDANEAVRAIESEKRSTSPTDSAFNALFLPGQEVYTADVVDIYTEPSMNAKIIDRISDATRVKIVSRCRQVYKNDEDIELPFYRITYVDATENNKVMAGYIWGGKLAVASKQWTHGGRQYLITAGFETYVEPGLDDGGYIMALRLYRNKEKVSQFYSAYISDYFKMSSPKGRFVLDHKKVSLTNVTALITLSAYSQDTGIQYFLCKDHEIILAHESDDDKWDGNGISLKHESIYHNKVLVYDLPQKGRVMDTLHRLDEVEIYSACSNTPEMEYDDVYDMGDLEPVGYIKKGTLRRGFVPLNAFILDKKPMGDLTLYLGYLSGSENERLIWTHTLEVALYQGDSLLGKEKFNAWSFYSTWWGRDLEKLENKGLDGAEVFHMAYSENGEGSETKTDVFLIWNGTKFHKINLTEETYDFDYVFVFPSDEGGKPAKVMVYKEYLDNRKKALVRTWTWDGNKLK